MDDESEDFGESSTVPIEEEESSIETMQIGDDFSDYMSIKSCPTPPRVPLAERSFDAFSDPETLEAMKRLGYVPEDLLPSAGLAFDPHNPSLRRKIFIELDRRRMQMMSDVIAERNRAVNSHALLANQRRTKKKKTKKKIIRASNTGILIIDKKLKTAEQRVKKLAEERRQKVAHINRVRMDRMKQHTEARIENMKERMKKAQKAREQSDRVRQNLAKMLADKQAAFRKKAKEREDRARAAREAELACPHSDNKPGVTSKKKTPKRGNE
jgi:hypothetical protein